MIGQPDNHWRQPGNLIAAFCACVILGCCIGLIALAWAAEDQRYRDWMGEHHQVRR